MCIDQIFSRIIIIDVGSSKGCSRSLNCEQTKHCKSNETDEGAPAGLPRQIADTDDTRDQGKDRRAESQLAGGKASRINLWCGSQRQY